MLFCDCRVCIERHFTELEKLRKENNKFREVLEKIADPRKRDHQEPDTYTQLECVMNMADEVLKECGE